jgi:GntR family transcriptional regulator/MocR family aminotransferase
LVSREDPIFGKKAIPIVLVRLDGRGPLHRQLHRAIRDAVLRGRLAPGTRLPATRALAEELRLSRSVVVRAYERLRADGVVESRVGAGTWVREGAAGREAGPAPAPDAAPASGHAAGTSARAPALARWARAAGSVWRPVPSPEPPPFDFRYGRVDPTGLPKEEWRRAVRRSLRTQSVEYAPPEGSEALRTALAAYLGRSRGVHCRPERILIVTGSQQALDLTARVLLDPDDAVILEEPHYQGARQTFVAAGARLRPCPVDTEGIVLPPDPVGQDTAPPRLAYVTPSHQFPTGGVLSLPRRLALLSWARRTGSWVLEDDYDAEFRYDLPPVEAVQALDDEGRVIYAGTFSKVLFPSLRLGYLVLPDALVGAFRTAKWLVDRHSPTLEQEALATFIAEGSYDRHLRRMRRIHGRRRAALLEALADHLGERVRVVGANAGVHVLVWLEGMEAARADDVAAAARRRGVGAYPVTPYYVGRPPCAGLLLGYAVMDEAHIREGVRRLGAALDEVGSRPRARPRPVN